MEIRIVSNTKIDAYKELDKLSNKYIFWQQQYTYSNSVFLI